NKKIIVQETLQQTIEIEKHEETSIIQPTVDIDATLTLQHNDDEVDESPKMFSDDENPFGSPFKSKNNTKKEEEKKEVYEETSKIDTNHVKEEEKIEELNVRSQSLLDELMDDETQLITTEDIKLESKETNEDNKQNEENDEDLDQTQITLDRPA